MLQMGSGAPSTTAASPPTDTQSVPSKPLFPNTAQVRGTLPWASPEAVVVACGAVGPVSKLSGPRILSTALPWFTFGFLIGES